MDKSESVFSLPQAMRRDQRAGLWDPVDWTGYDMKNLNYKSLWPGKERLLHCWAKDM